MANAFEYFWLIRGMRRANALQQSCFECGGLVEFLTFQNAQGGTDDLRFIGITSGAEEPFDQVAEAGWQRNRHKVKIPSRTGFVEPRLARAG